MSTKCRKLNSVSQSARESGCFCLSIIGHAQATQNEAWYTIPMEITLVWPLVVGVLGLIIGSFFNALEYRLAHGESIAIAEDGPARSACVHCKAVLRGRDLVPVLSFVVLRGKCHSCSERISYQYPLVELGTGLLGAIVAAHFGLTWEAVAYVLFAWVLMFIFLYDFKHQMILDVITLPAMAAAITAVVALGWDVQSAAIGAVIGGGFFAVQFIASKGKWIGGGDIRLGALMGIMLGWVHVLGALFLAYVGGALIAVFMLLFKKAGMQSRLPFGVFLTIAAMIMVLYGQEIIDWYIGLTL